MKLESVAQAFTRLRKDGRRPPARTFMEMAEEFGVKPRTLTAYMGHYPGAPSPIAHLGKGRFPARWYEVAAFRAWWKTVPRK